MSCCHVGKGGKHPRRPVKDAKLDDRGFWRTNMSIHLGRKDLINAQQMEVAVNGPDGATHLIFCTGVADLGCVSHETYTFLVGPQISRRQFVGAIASAAFSTILVYDKNSTLGVNLVSINADYDDESHQVKVRAEVISRTRITKLAISYNVSILAELPSF
jgi:hypothetical protein